MQKTLNTYKRVYTTSTTRLSALASHSLTVTLKEKKCACWQKCEMNNINLICNRLGHCHRRCCWCCCAIPIKMANYSYFLRCWKQFLDVGRWKECRDCDDNTISWMDDELLENHHRCLRQCSGFPMKANDFNIQFIKLKVVGPKNMSNRI